MFTDTKYDDFDDYDDGIVLTSLPRVRTIHATHASENKSEHIDQGQNIVRISVDTAKF